MNGRKSIYSYISEIAEYNTFSTVEPINKGRSSDDKYYVETQSGDKRLLRISGISEYDKKVKEYRNLLRISELEIDMSRPLGFGICNQGKQVYQLLTWCDGNEAKEVLPKLCKNEQYELGVNAGRLLRKIHTIDYSHDSSAWSATFSDIIDQCIEDYRKSEIKYKNDEPIIQYMKKYKYLIKERPICLTHGDYKVSNLIISPDRRVQVIDFGSNKIMDPYYDFPAVIYGATVSTFFVIGCIHGYFDNKVPKDFWDIVFVYIAYKLIKGLVWAQSYGEREVIMEQKMYQNVSEWFACNTGHIPSWYSEYD